MDDVFAGSLMSTPVQTIEPDASLQRAASTMLEHDSSSVVVVRPDGTLAGILTATDCVRACAQAAAADETTVASFMTSDLATASATDTVADLADALTDRGLHHLPVVDDGTPIGIVTTTDLTKYVAGLRPSEAPPAME